MTDRSGERRELARRAEAGDAEAAWRLLAMNQPRPPAGSPRTVRSSAGRTWEYYLRLDGGHKVFRDPTSGRWAIADDSGNAPDDTDDGILWIDLSRPINVSKWGQADRQVISVPLLRDSGDETWTPATTSEALWLSARLGLAINAPDGKFSASSPVDGVLGNPPDRDKASHRRAYVHCIDMLRDRPGDADLKERCRALAEILDEKWPPWAGLDRDAAPVRRTESRSGSSSRWGQDRRRVDPRRPIRRSGGLE